MFRFGLALIAAEILFFIEDFSRFAQDIFKKKIEADSRKQLLKKFTCVRFFLKFGLECLFRYGK